LKVKEKYWINKWLNIYNSRMLNDYDQFDNEYEVDYSTNYDADNEDYYIGRNKMDKYKFG